MTGRGSPTEAPELDLRLMDAVLRSGGTTALLDYCDELLEHAPADEALQLIRAALVLSSAALKQDPGQLPGHVLLRLSHIDDPAIQRLVAAARMWNRDPWLQPLITSRYRSGGPLTAGLRGHADHVTAVAITADGRLGVSGSVPRTVKFWDLESGTELRTLRGWGRVGQGEGYGQNVDALAISADARRVVATNGDGRIHVWDPTTGSLLQAVAGCDDETWRSALTADGRWAASAFVSSIVPLMTDKQYGTIDLWDLENEDLATTLRSRNGPTSALALTTDAEMLITLNGALGVWDRAQATHHTFEGLANDGTALAVTSRGDRAVTGHHNGEIRVWDIEPDQRMTSLLGHTAKVSSVAITPDGRRAVSGSADATVRVWDLETMTEVGRMSSHVGDVHCVAVSSDGRRAMSGGGDRVVRVWNLEQPGGLHGPAHHLPVRSVTFAGDGRQAISTSADGTQEVWQIGEGSPNDTTFDTISEEQPSAHPIPAELRDRIQALEAHEARGSAVHKVLALAVNADHTRAVSASQRWTVLSGHHRWAVDSDVVRVWDLGPEPRARILTEHSRNVVGMQQTEHHRDLAITTDGRYAVAVGDDQTITMWDLDSASPIASFTVDSPLRTCAISPAGDTVAAGSESGDVYLLRLTAWA